MNQKYAKLFEPVKIGKLTIKNRTSMAPMGLVCYADENGGFNEEAREYYVERAKGGVGLIITGLCFVNFNEIPDNATPCPTRNPLMFKKSTADMVERIHAYDSRIFLQLTGGLGRSAMPTFIKKAIAPSASSNRFNPAIQHEAMSLEAIKEMIADFVKSAVIAKECGFDGVEIHAVHEGYILDQFAIALFNQREDEYGGDLNGRLKIATDIVKGIKAACGKDFPVSLRYSVKSFMKGLRQGALPGEAFEEAGRDYEEGLEGAKILTEAGYDLLNVDAGTYDSWYWNHPPMYFEPGMYREFGRMVKQAVDVPVILAGRMDDPDIAIDALNGCCDLVSYGRPLLADPYLVEKIQTDHIEDIRPCLSCHDGCMGRIAKGLPLSCAVNPACGREKKYGLEPAAVKKKVLVIGGGIAGMEAARVCAVRGHKVTLTEALDYLGGNIIPGSVPDFKQDDRRLVRWYETQLKKLNVEIQLGQRADRALVEKLHPDAVIAATGSHPIMLDFGKKNHIVSAVDVLNGKETAKENVVIIGGGLVGCETALWLSGQGRNVTVIEMQDDILGGPHGMPFMNYDMLKDLLNYHHIDIKCSTKVTAVDENFVTAENNGESQSIKADTVILSVGYESDRELQLQLMDLDIPVYNVGDSRNVRNIMHAVWDAYEVSRML